MPVGFCRLNEFRRVKSEQKSPLHKPVAYCLLQKSDSAYFDGLHTSSRGGDEPDLKDVVEEVLSQGSYYKASYRHCFVNF